MFRKIRLALLAYLLMGAATANAQEFNALGLFGKDKLMKLNGDINTSFIYNYSSQPAQRDPFNYVLGGTLNVFLKGIDIPIAFAYTNQQVTVSPPINYNKISLHPHYKWVTLHLGTSSLTFSPYSLNGHQFDGIGTELTPGKFKITAMYGRLLKGTGNYATDSVPTPAYTRMGMGVAAQYTTDKLTIGTSVFHAKDNASTAINIPASMNIAPQQNFNVTGNAAFTILKNLKVTTEYARNYLTTNLGSAQKAYSDYAISGLITTNGTTVVQEAYNAKASYTWKVLDLGLEYERIDPLYTSLGAYYNQNGFENKLVHLGFSAFKSKLTLASGLGLQDDITTAAAAQKSQRIISTLNVTYAPTEKLNFNGSYNNINMVTNVRNLDNIATGNNLVPYYLDSLKLVMLDLTLGMNANYVIKATNNVNQTLSGTYTFQRGTKKQGDYFVDEEASKFHNGVLTFTSIYPQTQVQWTAGMNYTLTVTGKNNTAEAYGPSISFGKRLFHKKVAAVLGTDYNTTYTNTTSSRVNVYNIKCSLGYNIKKRHDFKFSTIVQLKDAADPLAGSLHTTTVLASLMYNYNF